MTRCTSYCSLRASGQAGLWGVDAPADAPRSEKRAFGRPSVKRRAGLSSSSVVGLIAVSIRAIFVVGAAPGGWRDAESTAGGCGCLAFPPLRQAAAALLEPYLGAREDATDR